MVSSETILLTISAFAAAVSAGAAAISVYFSFRQIRLAFNPYIGVDFGRVEFVGGYDASKEDFDNNSYLYMTVLFECYNLGNSPAIEVIIDSELELPYTDTNGLINIPSEANCHISFIDNSDKDHDKMKSWNKITFNEKCAEIIKQDILKGTEACDKNHKKKRILRLFIYYKNSLGIYFKSTYETWIDFSASNRYPYSIDELSADEIKINPSPPPIYLEDKDSSYLDWRKITKKKMDKEIKQRNMNREFFNKKHSKN